MRKPNTTELEDLVRWFTRHMSAETRVQLMGDLPVHYKLLYPSVSDEQLHYRVSQRLEAVSGQSDIIPHLINL